MYFKKYFKEMFFLKSLSINLVPGKLCISLASLPLAFRIRGYIKPQVGETVP